MKRVSLRSPVRIERGTCYRLDHGWRDHWCVWWGTVWNRKDWPGLNGLWVGRDTGLVIFVMNSNSNYGEDDHVYDTGREHHCSTSKFCLDACQFDGVTSGAVDSQNARIRTGGIGIIIVV